MMAVGTSFYGIFSANNTPDNANFPNGVTYQRNANFATKTLLAIDNVTPVPTSIDPFFFKVMPGTGRVVTAIANDGNFADTCVGSFVDEELTIDNGGDGPLSITKITSSSPDFVAPSVVSYPIKLGAGRFDRGADPLRADQPWRQVRDRSPCSATTRPGPQGPGLRLGASAAAEPAHRRRRRLREVCVGSFADEPLVLNNSGRCPLTVSAHQLLLGRFVSSRGAGVSRCSIAPGDSLPAADPVRADSFGAKSATITVTSNDPGSPHTVTVNGKAPVRQARRHRLALLRRREGLLPRRTDHLDLQRR